MDGCSTLDDEKIVRLARSPDPQQRKAGEEALTGKYLGRLIGAGIRRLHLSHDDAQDLAMAVLERATDRLDQLRTPGALGAWLMTSLFRRRFDELRKLNRPPPKQTPELALLGWNAPAGLDGEALRAWTRAQRPFVARAANQLNPRYREVLSAIVTGLSNAEIAQMQGITLNAATVLRHRTIRAMQRELRRLGVEIPATPASEEP